MVATEPTGSPPAPVRYRIDAVEGRLVLPDFAGARSAPAATAYFYRCRALATLSAPVLDLPAAQLAHLVPAGVDPTGGALVGVEFDLAATAVPAATPPSPAPPPAATAALAT